MDNSIQRRSYDSYTSLFNKACSSVLFLVLTILTSALCVGTIISLFKVVPTGDLLSIIFAILPALFMTLTTIGLWTLFASAKNNNINGGTFGLVRSYPKYDQVIKTIVVILVIIGVIALLIGLFMIKAEFDEAVDSTGSNFEEIKHELKDSLKDANIPEEYTDAVYKVIDKLDYYLTTGLTIITVIAILIVVFLIFELIRCGMLVKFITSAGKMYKTGHMVAPPSMFFCVLNYIIGAISIIGSLSASQLFEFDWITFVTGVVQILIGVIVMINRNELKAIYATWKMEIGMVSSDAAAANAPVNTFVPNVAPVAPVETPVAPVEAPVEVQPEAPVEAPVEVQPEAPEHPAEQPADTDNNAN